MACVPGCCRKFFLLVVLGISGCGTTENALLPDGRGTTTAMRSDDARSRTGATKGPSAQTDSHASKTTFLEGSGSFVGPPAAARIETGSLGNSGGITLNLVNVPTPQAAKTILGDVLAVKYTIDPNVKGEVTVQTPEPVTKAAIMDLFQSALRANGAAIVNTRGLYRIVPVDQAMAGAPVEVEGAGGASERLGSGLHVVQLKYVSALEMQRILEPIAPRGSNLRADDARHILTLSGSSAEIAGMREAISVFDVDVMKGMSFALVPVKSSQPTALAEELRTVFASDREGPMSGMVRFLPNNRLRAILVITPQRQYLGRAETWVRRLDAQAEGTEKQFFTYLVQNRRAQELVTALQAMFANEGGGRGGGASRNVAPTYQEASVQTPQPQQMSQGSSASGSSLFTGIGGGGQSRAQQGSGSGSRPSGSGASLGVDEATGDPRIKLAADGAKNALLIEATPADYRRIMKMVSALDVMPNQVMIEATIAEVTLNDDLKMGVRWYLQQKNAGYTFSDAATGALGSVFPGFSYALTAANVRLTLNALSDITSVNVVSSPSLTVMDNSTAVLQIGDQVPITTQSATSVLGAGAPIVNSVTYRDTGVILSMTPRINESGRVLLDIEQEVSTVVSTTSSTIDSPTIRQRKIRTSVVVNNGEALALGGMIQESKTVGATQVPILGQIPLLGNAFKQKDNSMGKTELIIIITPRVMRNLDEARLVTEDYRREFERHVLADRDQHRRIERGARRLLE